MIGKVHLTKKYARYRLEEPKKFSKFRIKDVGRKGHTKLVLGKKKRTGKWERQAILIDRNDYEQGLRVGFISKKPILIRKVI